MGSEQIVLQYNDYKDIYTYLMDQGEISYASYIDNVYKKNLILSAASYFECQICEAIKEYAKRVSTADKRIVRLIEKKVLERQYHTLFDWDRKNTNAFWSLFGEDTKTRVRSQLDADDNIEYRDAELAFLEVGRLRNQLVHQNYAEYMVQDLTATEIYKKYERACKFLEFTKTVLDPAYLKK